MIILIALSGGSLLFSTKERDEIKESKNCKVMPIVLDLRVTTKFHQVLEKAGREGWRDSANRTTEPIYDRRLGLLIRV